MKFNVVAAMIACSPTLLSAQQTPDTVEIELARTSKIVFTMEDSNDLWQLKHYDFQALFDDILAKLEKQDTTGAVAPADAVLPPVVVEEDADEAWEERESYKDYEEDIEIEDLEESWTSQYPSSRQFFNMDFGINNYAPDKNSPDLPQPYYTVHPWGSWTVALNAMNKTRFSESFSLETSLGVSWYNFKFEEDNTFISQTPTGVIFIPDQRDLYFTKSKLTVSYVNLSLIPVFNTGPANDDRGGWHRWTQSAFRIGVGPYIGYRLGSHSKQQYELNGDKQTEKVHDDFYLENFRYGLRFQIGVRGADFFVNYDLNELFTEGNGPELHPFSFGFIF
jgi:hypothetical protein